MLCGGTTASKPADDEIKELCNALKAALESKVGQNFAEFSVVEYMTQVVAGTNYFVKIHVGGSDYVHARIFKPLPCHGTTPEVHSVQTSKTKEEKLAYF